MPRPTESRAIGPRVPGRLVRRSCAAVTPLLLLLSACGQSRASAPSTPATTATPATTVTTATTTLEDVVDAAIEQFTEVDDDPQDVHMHAWMASAVAVRRGWHDPAVAEHLAGVYRRQNPDGGYGIGFAWDAFGDGSVNPADTTYAITLSDHVGPVLLDGWRAGVVPAERVQRIVDLLGSFPLAAGEGTCIAYSNSPADIAAPCVPNINASAAAFLTRAADAGFTADLTRVPAIVEHDRRTLLADDWWPYIIGRTVRQDWQHNATMVDAYMTLDPALGQRTLTAMRQASTDDPYEEMALLRLAPYDCSLATPTAAAAVLDQNPTSSRLAAITAYEAAVAVAAC